MLVKARVNIDIGQIIPVAANPGTEYLMFDQGSALGVQDSARKLHERFPKLNVLVNNAGVQCVKDLTSGETSDAETTINTNLRGPIRLTASLIERLVSQPQAAILNVTSTLAMMPAAMMPSYCVTKAAMHSYTQSLR